MDERRQKSRMLTRASTLLVLHTLDKLHEAQVHLVLSDYSTFCCELVTCISFDP